MLCRSLKMACVSALSISLFAGDQKRPLTHDDYDAWQSVRGRVVSTDGNWIAMTIAPQVGDAELQVSHAAEEVVYRHSLGESARFSPDNQFLIFKIAPLHADQIAFESSKLKRGKEKNKDKKPEEPKASLGIMDLSDGSVTVVDRVKKFEVPEEGPSFVIYQLEEEQREKSDSEDEEKTTEKKEKENDEKKSYLKDGTKLVIRNLRTAEEKEIENVITFGVTKKNGFIYFTLSTKKEDPEVVTGCFAIHLESGREVSLVEGAADFKHFTVDRDVRRLVFISNRRDRDAEKPTYDLYAWDFEAPSAERIVSHHDTADFPNGRSVSGEKEPQFSHDGGVVQFYAGKIPEQNPVEVLESEKVVLDLWHYQDSFLQPMQAKSFERNKDLPIACVWHFDQARMVTLTQNPDESFRFLTPDGSRGVIQDNIPYARDISWDRRYYDIHVVNTIDGSRSRVAAKVGSRISQSPDGRFLLHFENCHWHSIDVSTGKVTNLTKGLSVSFADEEWDTPSPPRPYGIAGWTEDDKEVILYDRYDLWRMKPDGSQPQCVTDGFGRVNQIRFRAVQLDPEQRFFDEKERLFLSALNLQTMASGFYRDRLDTIAKPERQIMVDKSFRNTLAKAKEASRLVFNLSTFSEPPDVWVSDLAFQERRRITHLNAQQEKVRWGAAELVRWHSSDGIPLKGILIKPEDFDAKRKYPMKVYFYEKLSTTLHRYRAPSPGTSPNAAYYVSNGYLWFMPDIVYRTGYPGESCMKSVVSGVQKLISMGFVDESNIGAAGHSWGGYQTAYLITQTDIFSAVESGAPVSNMTSAYGGIRWGSGMSRAFQYERTQSRIGGSLWEYPLRFIENSPLFHADKVRTPILMLHNDKDGAVPWYQGIEFFTALRRLEKEAYLFNYVNADHGLRKRANQMDWTIRMQQYFDHHLRGAPKPAWMRDGVPFSNREKEKLRFHPPVNSIKAHE